MNIAHEIAKNIKADCIDDLIDLDYEGRFLRRKKLVSNKKIITDYPIKNNEIKK